jgi:site-specific recombinase XerD
VLSDRFIRSLAAAPAGAVENRFSAVNRPIIDRGSPVAANRTLADLKHLFSFAYEKGWVKHNVTERITRKVIGGKEKSREIILTEQELTALIRELKSDCWQPETRVGLVLCLLTGQQRPKSSPSKSPGRGGRFRRPSRNRNASTRST